MVATLTHPTAACSLGQEERCAEDGASGVEEREGGQESVEGQESGDGEVGGVCCVLCVVCCVWGGEGRRGEGRGKGGGREGLAN